MYGVASNLIETGNNCLTILIADIIIIYPLTKRFLYKHAAI